MRVKQERCPICDSTKFYDLDYLRDVNYWYVRDLLVIGEQVGFKICRNCAFVTYDYNDDQHGQYDAQRKSVNIMTVIAGNVKNAFRREFLKDVCGMLPNNPAILDVGCADGSFLKMLMDEQGYTNLDGIEYAETLGNFARNEYKLNVVNHLDKLDADKKYDMISYYRVLEHIPNPDIELMKIKERLNDGGFLYVSVPTWFNVLTDEMSGAVCSDFEDYYHINHLNVYTDCSFENLMNKCGFEIVKKNTTLHHMTMLLKKGPVKDIVKEDHVVYIADLEKQREAMNLFNASKYGEEIALYPKYVDAHLYGCMTKDVMKDFDAIRERLAVAIELCGRNHKLVNQLAKHFFQWDENRPERQYYSNNIKMAEALFNECVNLRPGIDDAYYFLGIIEGKYKKNIDKAVEWFKRFLALNPTKVADAWNMIGYFRGLGK